jgi:hypothetical protein
MIETVVESIRVSLVTQHRVVILKEVDGERHLPMRPKRLPWSCKASPHRGPCPTT